MYFTSDAGGKHHIWRQRSDGGAPEQVTSGPNEEEGIAMAPDGRSLITSVGEEQSEVWFHDREGDRSISSQGSGLFPAVSSDGQRVYYLVRRQKTLAFSFAQGELWVADLASHRAESVLPGVSISSYHVSADGKRILYSVVTPEQKSEIWMASAQRRFPPRRLSSGKDLWPRFGQAGDVYFGSSESNVNYLYRMKEDGTGRQKVSPRPILGLPGISPDGKWALVWSALAEEDSTSGFLLFPTDGGSPRKICNRCSLAFPPDGKYLYLSLGRVPGESTNESSSTFVIPFPGALPAAFSAGGVNSAADLRRIPGVLTINQVLVSPGPDLAIYAFVKTSVHRNLYRVSLP
jgi:Tol biopolymer transport system component